MRVAETGARFLGPRTSRRALCSHQIINLWTGTSSPSSAPTRTRQLPFVCLQQLRLPQAAQATTRSFGTSSSSSGGGSSSTSTTVSSSSTTSSSSTALTKTAAAAVAGLATYGLFSTFLTPRSLVEDFDTPAGPFDFSVDGAQALLRDLTWLASGAFVMGVVRDQHYKPLCELVGGVGRREDNHVRQLKTTLSRARGSMRWLAFGLVLSGTQLAAGAASFVYSTRRTSCSSDADLLYRRYRARRSKYLGGEVEASISVEAEEQLRVRKLTFDEFYDLVTALRQRDFSRAAAVYKINSDVDALLLLHLLKDLRLLAGHLEWVKDGLLRRRKEKELYVEVEKMAERRIDDLGEGFVRKTLLPLLVTPGDEENRRMKTSSSSFFYPRGFLRHCFEFAKEERTVGSGPDNLDPQTSEERVNRYLYWRRLNPFAFFVVPLLSGARWYMLSDVGVVQAASDLLSKFTTGAGSLKNLNSSIQQVVIPRAKTGLWGVLRLYLHGVNAAVLGYTAYYGVWQYFYITSTSTTTTTASPSPSAASGTKVRVLPEEGILWRSKPLWFAFAGDDSSSCGASEVFFAGDNRGAKLGEIVENGEVVVNANGEEWLRVSGSRGGRGGEFFLPMENMGRKLLQPL